MLASSLTASLVLRICRSCMSFCEMTVTVAGVCSNGASLKPPTAARLAAGALLAVTTTSAMLCGSLAALSVSVANAGAANACRMARVRTETDTFKDEFGVGIDGSWYKPVHRGRCLAGCLFGWRQRRSYQRREVLCAFLRWHYPDQVRRVSLTRKTYMPFPGPLAK